MMRQNACYVLGFDDQADALLFSNVEREIVDVSISVRRSQDI